MSKKFITFILSLIVINNICFSQFDNWEIIGTRRPLYSINFISQNKVIIYGNDIIYKSIDGGENFSLPIVQSPEIQGSFDRLSFVDSLYGWSLFNSHSIYKTTNGGNFWNEIYIGLNFYSINGIYFIDRNKGWITTESWGAIHGIARTTNGGVNWNIINNNLPFQAGQICMVNENKGFILPISFENAWDSLGRTINGGFNWTYQRIGIGGQPGEKFFFIDSLKGWVLGDNGYVSKTINGGLNWTAFGNSLGNLLDIFFLNSSTGWLTTVNGEIYKSTNGGINWIQQFFSEGGSYNIEGYMLDVYFKNENTGWALKGDGTLYKSSNSGLNWTAQIYSPLGKVVSLNFISNNDGLVLSNYDFNYYGFIYKTTNRGYIWNKVFSLSNAFLYDMQFINNITGYACGNSGYIIKTTNFGNNWVQTTVLNTDYKAVSFINENTGWVCGNGGVVIKTTNGGLNWVNQSTDILSNINDIYMIDYQNGFIAADSGYILRTTNSGVTWSTIYPADNSNYIKTYFFDNNIGFALSNRLVYIPPYFASYTRRLLRTTNAGQNWNQVINETSGALLRFYDLFFLNPETGWITANNEIKKTTNNGINWFAEQSPINRSLNCVKFIDENNGWIGGDNGTILSTSSPIGIQNINLGIPNGFSLTQNYPNPFNPQTKIKFDIPKQSFAKLIIYDILGREVAILVNEQLKPGTYEVDWDGSNYSSGVYFYKLVSGDYVETKKMALIK